VKSDVDLALEIRPMVTLIRWRVARARGEAIDTSRARRLDTGHPSARIGPGGNPAAEEPRKEALN
jgi:hypothetical protein